MNAVDLKELKEAAERPYAWVKDSPGYFDPATGGEPPYTDFSDEPRPGYAPLIQANPSTILSLIERVTRAEEALTNIGAVLGRPRTTGADREWCVAHIRNTLTQTPASNPMGSGE
jgi:hypothetical protein